MSTLTTQSYLRQITPADIRRGVPAAAIEEMVSFGIERGSVMRLIGAPSTLRRRIKENQLLTRDESDRLARLARIVSHAEQVFGSQQKAAHWLERASRTRTDRASPMELLDTDPGAEWVEERLIQIAHGMFA